MKVVSAVRDIFILVFLFLLDGQVSTVLANLLPVHIHVISHIVFLPFLWFSLRYQRLFVVTVAIFLGLFYDVYFFNILGLAVFIFPIVMLLFSTYNEYILKNGLTYTLSLLVLLFSFQMITYLVVTVLGLTGREFTVFVLYSLVPTVLWNVCFYLLSYPLIRKIFI